MSENIKDRIVFEDKDIIIYNKAAGKLVQSNRSFDVDVVSELMTYLATKGERQSIHVINRLDRPVSGLVLLAKGKEAAKKITAKLTNNDICKEYYAVVCGRSLDPKGRFEDYLVKDSKTNMSKICRADDADAKKAVLEYEVLSTRDELSLVKIKLITGRHHQIRAQFAYHNHPLFGDTKYNKELVGERGWSNIALCSYHIEFDKYNFTITPEGEGFEYFKKELETI